VTAPACSVPTLLAHSTLRFHLVLWFCATLACLHLSSAAHAQDHTEPAPEPHKGDPEPEHRFDAEADYLALADTPLFLPRSYLYWGTPVGPKDKRQDLVFALEYALHLSIYNNVRDQALNGKHWAGATTLSFEGDLRMLSTESKPVRMPSYRPNLSGQLFYLWHRAQPMVVGLRSGVYHYSNGQEQCTFDRSQRDDSDACTQATKGVTDPSLSLNRVNGNFSSNGWLLELNGRMHQVNSKGVAVGHLSAGLSVLGMINKGPGAMEPALQRLYGWGKLSASLEGKKRFGWASVTLRGQATYYPSTNGGTPNKAFQSELVLGPYWLTGLGFFARYYGGRDYYNAFFVDKIQQFAAGLAWDGERPLKFKR
jgi:hypothetical protein